MNVPHKSGYLVICKFRVVNTYSVPGGGWLLVRMGNDRAWWLGNHCLYVGPIFFKKILFVRVQSIWHPLFFLLKNNYRWKKSEKCQLSTMLYVYQYRWITFLIWSNTELTYINILLNIPLFRNTNMQFPILFFIHIYLCILILWVAFIANKYDRLYQLVIFAISVNVKGF